MMDFKVFTTVEDDLIQQSVFSLQERLSTELMNTKDTGVRDALKKLGWLSPEEAARLTKQRDYLLNAIKDLSNWHGDDRFDLLITSVEEGK